MRLSPGFLALFGLLALTACGGAAADRPRALAIVNMESEAVEVVPWPGADPVVVPCQTTRIVQASGAPEPPWRLRAWRVARHFELSDSVDDIVPGPSRMPLVLVWGGGVSVTHSRRDMPSPTPASCLPTSGVTGRVSAQLPPTGIIVQAIDAETLMPVGIARTGIEGTFTIGLAPGRYRIAFRRWINIAPDGSDEARGRPARSVQRDQIVTLDVRAHSFTRVRLS